MELREDIVVLLLLMLLAVSEGSESNVEIEEVNIWPMPQAVKRGNSRMYLNRNLLLTNEGSKYVDSLRILKEGFDRMINVIQMSHVVGSNFSDFPKSNMLQGLHIVISSPSHELNYGIDESYGLQVPSPDKPSFARIEAQTVYGALHGLETFSQLCQFNITTRAIEVNMAPWTITDKPRFSYRGLLIDTSRHYLPLLVIKKVIDSMSYTKLNVLHWHVVDSQSFPLEIPSYPKLWDGAYSIFERYTVSEAAEVVSYARRRGINVLGEIDVPGHALSWGTGYPSLWPASDCQEPLDVSSEFTFKLIDGILSDFSKIFKFKFIHLGGDEVNTSCWKTTPRIMKWLTKRGMTASQAYQYFVLRAQNLALSHGFEIVNWEETFNHFGDKLSRKTVVHNWLGRGVAEKVTAAGLRCIVSNQENWYLDHLDAKWQGFYLNEPFANITNSEQQKLVIGGEVCMWGEKIDGSDIEQTLWPRAAAAAERLWTPLNKMADDPSKVTGRLTFFRCLLNQRGVAAAPLKGYGRDAPRKPGSCYLQ